MKETPSPQKNNYILPIVFGAVTIFFGFILFPWTLVPHFQMIRYRDEIEKALVLKKPAIFTDDAFIFKPNTYIQGSLRLNALTVLFNEYTAGRTTISNPVFDKSLEEMEAYVKNNPNRYEFVFALAKAYDVQAVFKNDPSLYKIGEKYHRDALSLVPDRQELIYTLVINLLNQNRTSEGIKLIKDYTAKYPDTYENHFELGQAYAISGGKFYDDALAELEIALSHGVNINHDLTKDAYEHMLQYYYKNKDKARFLTVVERLATIDNEQKKDYEDLAAYIKERNTFPVLNIVAP